MKYMIDDTDRNIIFIVGISFVILMIGCLFMMNYFATDSRVLKCNALDKEFFLTQSLNQTSLEFVYDNCLSLIEEIMEVRNE